MSLESVPLTLRSSTAQQNGAPLASTDDSRDRDTRGRRRLKIGLLCYEDANSIHACSGTPYHLAHYLRQQGHQVRVCAPYPVRFRSVVKLINRIVQRAIWKHIVEERFPLISFQYAGIVDRFAEENPDLDLLLVTAVLCADRKRCKIPIIAWDDTTAAGVMNRYPYYTDIPEIMVRWCHEVEQRGLNACDQVVFSSQWAADVALQNYRVSPDKVHVITFGANILRWPDRTEIDQILARRDSGPRRAILVGVKWQRKGVDRAIEIVGELRRQGYDINLQVVGCLPPPGTQVPEWVEVTGRIPKNTPEGQARFYRLLESAHVFLLPTLAECAAVSLVEANAYGVPAVTSDVGGNGSLIRNGVNGYLCSLHDPITVWADAVRKIVYNEQTYRDQCLRAYELYENELNWKKAVLRLEELMWSTVLRQQM